MSFQVNGAAPTPECARPPAGNEGCMIHFPEAGQLIRGDGHSVTVGKPWLRLTWAHMPAAGAAYWYAFFVSDTTPSVALTSVQAYNPRTGGYTTYNTSAILHRPTFQSVHAGVNIWYEGFEVLISELS